MTGSMFAGIAFVLLVGSAVLWFRLIERVQIPKDRRGFVACWLLAAALGIYALTTDVGWISGIPAGIAVFGGLLFPILFVISPQKVAEDVIRVGERLRDFTALDENGNEFAIATTAGKPVLLKFFRGHW